MSRRVLWFPALALLAACGIEPTQPNRPLREYPQVSAQIADGSKEFGNPDFFWLFPMVPPPINDLDYDRGKSDGSHRPDLFICALNTSDSSQVDANTACKPGGYTKSYSGITPGFRYFSADDDIGQYHQFWPTPVHNDVFYRIRAKVGQVELGYIDVQTIKKLTDNPKVNKQKFTPQMDGVTMLIRFRIEQGALCFVVGGCTGSGVVNTKTGGTVVNAQGDGVTIPAQGSGGQTVVVNVPTNPCPDIPSDLPHVGQCFSVTTTPDITLMSDATVWVCDVSPATPGSNTDPRRNITMYRYDAVVPPGAAKTNALPHAHDKCPPIVGGFAANASVKGMFADLVRGKLKSAGRQLAGLVGPRPLYATAALDVGAGGLTLDFSDFQLMVPAKITPCSPWIFPPPVGATMYALSGTQNPDTDPTVCATDKDNLPVAGVTVRFSTNNGTLGATSVVTGTNGVATVPWTPGPPGSATITAFGNGVAATDSNGPRNGVDPFQPLLHAEGTGVLEQVDTGHEPLNATVLGGDALPVNYGSAGWSYQIDGSPTANWFKASGAPFANPGTAPFRSETESCALNAAVVPAKTSWPTLSSTFLYARKTFAVASPTSVSIGIAIDNDVQVYLDGIDITSTRQQPPPSTITDGMLIHEGCPTLDSFVFTTPVLNAGVHIIAIRAKDRGGSAYFDAKVLPPS